MEKKSNYIALQYRNAGNDHFRKQEYFEALMFYNRSLCCAEIGNESIPIAFANRSAVYIRLNQFDLCLENIQLARKHNYPPEKMEKLDKREEECKELMKTLKPNPDDDPFNYFKLSYPANPKYPQIVDCLELRNNRKFGKHVVTTRDLKTGDIIAIEEPTYSRTNVGARLYRCNFCLKDQLLNFIPCSGCALAMFCSEKCQQKAMKNFHQFECNTENFKTDFDSKICELVQCLSTFDYNVEELKQFLEANKKPVTIFDFDFSDSNDPMYEKNILLVKLSSLGYHLPCMELYFSHICGIVEAFVQRNPKMRELWKGHGNFLNGFLKKVATFPAETVATAFFSKNVNIEKETDMEVAFKALMRIKPHSKLMKEERTGEISYLFRDMLQHSCDPNIKDLMVSNKNVIYACKPIKKGGRISRHLLGASNSFTFFGPTSDRRNKLNTIAGIHCECEACTNDWPTLRGLRAVDPFFCYPPVTSFATHKETKKIVARNNAYVDKNYKECNPTQEVYATIHQNNYELVGLSRPAFYP